MFDAVAAPAPPGSFVLVEAEFVLDELVVSVGWVDVPVGSAVAAVSVDAGEGVVAATAASGVDVPAVSVELLELLLELVSLVALPLDVEAVELSPELPDSAGFAGSVVVAGSEVVEAVFELVELESEPLVVEVLEEESAPLAAGSVLTLSPVAGGDGVVDSLIGEVEAVDEAAAASSVFSADEPETGSAVFGSSCFAGSVELPEV